MAIEERHILEELENVCMSYPVDPGETLSHATMHAVEQRGWCKRYPTDGRFYPTCAGLTAFFKLQREGKIPKGE